MISFTTPDISEEDLNRFCLLKECIAIDNNLFLYGDKTSR